MGRKPRIDVAYGAPERSVSEADLLRALQLVAVNFDESPDEMHAVLSPAGLGVRWLTFATSVFRRGRVLAERHFWEILERELPELVMVTTSGYGAGPWRFEAGGTVMSPVYLRVEGDGIAVYRQTLPSEARRDGEVDEIGLGAFGLPVVRPLEILSAPTHEVRLRDRGKVPRALRIQKLAGPVLSCRVRPDMGLEARPPKERFPRVDRLADKSNPAELVAVIARSGFQKAASLAATYGEAIVPALVRTLAQPDVEHDTVLLCLKTLSIVGAAPEAIFPWATGNGRCRHTREHARAALARLGERARPVLEAHVASKDEPERSMAEALLQLLDDPRYAPLREVRAARDEVAKTLGPQIHRTLATMTQSASKEPLERIFAVAGPRGAGAVALALQSTDDHGTNGRISDWVIIGLSTSVDNVAWAVACHLVEQPQLDTMGAINSARSLGPSFEAVAAQLLTFTPLADDPVLGALAAGRPSPSMDEIAALRRKRKPSPDRAKPKRRKTSAKKKAAKTKRAPISRRP